jgi:hypothetical protein
MQHILSSSVPFSISSLPNTRAIGVSSLGSIGLFLLEWFAFYHKTEHVLDFIKHISNAIMRLMIYALILLFILIFAGNQTEFIYAQF